MKKRHHLHDNRCKCGKLICDEESKCVSCAHLKHGFYSKNIKTFHYCKCGNKIWIAAVKCNSCENKRRYRLGILNNKGKNNGQYIHGLDKREYPKEFNTELKLSIFKRDNYTCQKCKTYPCNDLTVHHTDYNKDNSDERNLITLCRKCNSEVNFNRDYWYAYFTYLRENEK